MHPIAVLIEQMPIMQYKRESDIHERRNHIIITCKYCNDAFEIDKICTKYIDNICYDCLEEKKDIITDCIINIKKKRLPFKNACNRISRNPIFNQYLLRKVFVKRFEEIF